MTYTRARAARTLAIAFVLRSPAAPASPPRIERHVATLRAPSLSAAAGCGGEVPRQAPRRCAGRPCATSAGSRSGRSGAPGGAHAQATPRAAPPPGRQRLTARAIALANDSCSALGPAPARPILPAPHREKGWDGSPFSSCSPVRAFLVFFPMETPTAAILPDGEQRCAQRRGGRRDGGACA
jgi:hypothetical protein